MLKFLGLFISLNLISAGAQAVSDNWGEKPNCSLYSSESTYSYTDLIDLSRDAKITLCVDDQKYSTEELSAMADNHIQLSILGNKTWIDAYALANMASDGDVSLHLDNESPTSVETLKNLVESGVHVVLNLKNAESSYDNFILQSLKTSGVHVYWLIDDKNKYDFYTVTSASRSGVRVRLVVRPYEYDGFELQRLREAGVEIVLK